MEHPLFEKGYNRTHHPGERSRQKISSSDLNAWLRDVFDRNFTSELEVDGRGDVARESAWLFSDLGTCLKLQLENLAFQAVTTFKYAAI